MKRTSLAEPIQPAMIVSAIPKQDVPARLAALPSADIRDLKEQWRYLFGTEPPPYMSVVKSFETALRAG